MGYSLTVHFIMNQAICLLTRMAKHTGEMNSLVNKMSPSEAVEKCTLLKCFSYA